jgi:hypothetical protein
VLLSSSVLDRQFRSAEPLDEDRHWGLLAVDRRDGDDRALLWRLPEPPAAVTEKFAGAGIASVVTTTMSTLSDPHARIPFSPRTPVFVLIDLPVLPVLRGLADEDGPVLWTHAEAGGDRILHLIVLALPGPDPLLFVHVASAHAVTAAVEWLRRRPDQYKFDPAIRDRAGPHLAALARHLVGSFWVFGATRAFH